MCASESFAEGKRQEGTSIRASQADCRFTRRHRIADSHIFREAFEQGRKFVGRFMVLWLRDAGDAELRLGVVASKRTFRRAVDRGRAKRLLRESFRLHRNDLCGRQDMVLVGRRRILEASCQDVEKDLLVLAGKAKILSRPEEV